MFMKIENDRSRWYDGLFYSMMIDPIAGKSFAQPISRLVSDGSTALDIGSGTGALVTALSAKCAQVTGIDLSPKMVEFARKRLRKNRINNAEIVLLSATEFSGQLDRRYDYVIMTQFLHEIPEDARDRVMDEAKKVTREFIFADFIAPYPNTLNGRLIRLVEMSAGKKHNANFNNWVERGGLDAFIRSHRLKINEERLYKTGVGKIIKACC
jgi:ubiquinone/menaquinone biosynthesis C-methylase UbiE